MEGNDSDRESSREWIQAGGKAGRLLAPAFFLAKKNLHFPSVLAPDRLWSMDHGKSASIEVFFTASLKFSKLLA
jgi:hypothetical protein